jgi:hypothetical protein
MITNIDDIDTDAVILLDGLSRRAPSQALGVTRIF